MSKENLEAETKDEIREIMNEIESIKQNITQNGEKEVTPPNMTKLPSGDNPTVEEEKQAQDELRTLDETNSEDTSHLDTHLDDGDAQVIPFKNNQPSDDGSLQLTLQGKITLHLKYEYLDQTVTLHFSDQSLNVQLADGTEFKIPVHKPSAAVLKQVA
ncbi:MAG: hypothetical protein HY072_03990 [Deltaproteobacteria bacterium]|nr:hypothetical protein [Deltaproteobacteria bacterium]